MEQIKGNKRKTLQSNLQRRVRARREEPEEVFSEESQGEESSEGEDGTEEDQEQDDDESGSQSDDSDNEEADDPTTTVSQISFGALAKAQASLPSTRRGKNRKNQDDANSDDDEDSDQNDRHKSASDSKSKPKPSRSSKHAPTEQSSKRPVTRRREVIAVQNKPVPRDPRFSSAISTRAPAPGDDERARRAYSFLDEYRTSEIARLREAARKEKNPSSKEELKRALASMESKKAAQDKKDESRRLLEEHRKREKELVKQGKKPFYLKKSEQKKQLLVDRFAGMKGKQVDRAIERRRKKLTARERRDMPMARRGAEV
ncbi:DUF947-domain-containing protein [Hypoxylon trugodes]|uniref:DUF947-domain-containing protein n=1 Tax=Hypoxylon trugodes TaxID=326681 RepID=UPI00219EE68B|nr:DUF947-domain-containing protein [Hypoxylon trugodes]KAI1391041.1 DUF947-domain-containing protein [Hypoxylon trugodes]